MAADDAQTERWAYAGKIVDTKGRLRDVWYDLTDNSLKMYNNLKADIVGGLYDLRVDRQGERVTIYGRAEWAGERMDDHTKMTEFIVRDMSERTKHSKLRAEKNEPGSLDEAMEPLLKYARQCHTSAQRSALCATIIDRLYRPWLQ